MYIARVSDDKFVIDSITVFCCVSENKYVLLTINSLMHYKSAV